MDKIINNVPLPYEPKKTNRFGIKFPEHFNLSEWICFEMSRPTLTFIGQDNGKIIYDWNDLVLKLYDPIAPSTTQSLMDLIHKNKINDKFNLLIEMYDPTGVVVEKWALSDCEFSLIDFGTLSYHQDEPVVCTLVIKLNKVVLEF